MKRLLLVMTLCFLGTASVQAQCTPDIIYADSIFGVWPDTTTNFPPAFINEAYFTQLDLLIPENTSDVPNLPVPISAPIDSGIVLSVAGLPPGMDYVCNSHTSVDCTYLPQTLGCAVLEGTPTEVGTFDITITVRAYVLFLGSTVEFDVEFDGYRVVVNTADALGESDALRPVIGQNVPNPFNDETIVPFSLVESGTVTMTVVNMLGETVLQESMAGLRGDNTWRFNGADFNEGIYLYSVISDHGVATRRMVIER